MAENSDKSDKNHDTPPASRDAQDVTAGKGRRDEVGRTGIYPSSGPLPEGDAPAIAPGEMGHLGRRNLPVPASREREGPGVERNDDLRGAERLPRKGNEMDKPDSDRLGE
jgi:hypothetical protein